ncbi:MAG: glutamine--fructose-6-phosphate transaminase (isomerizing) [Oscillospiraceae bacterium]|jgi:glucosamine--fructose-6-phosphate aminotransferase (isomerizing)|nr:glutamine--fructose-6-phosphate transaminase (isomerizing) [Oscillospiraceae bacterium]
MCGIIGYAGNRNAVPVIVDGLKKLEYRGYDSAGIAVFGADGFDVVKQKGRLAALESRLEGSVIAGNVGIGHTRWATHGEPSDVNSHPHVGSKSKIAIVHNGIIENYKRLKERLERKGVRFVSQTDSEVIAQLAEYYYKGDLMDTVIKVSGALEGSYALGIMCLDEPDLLVAVRKDNPLIVGVAEHGNFIASDVPAVLKHTNKVYYLEDGEIAVLTKDGADFLNMDKEPLKKRLETVSWSFDSAEKGGYPHFMLKEIMEQPKVLKDTIHSVMSNGENKSVADGLDISAFDKIVITACGSAYNAGVVAKYVFERLCRVSVEVELASEFRYKDAVIDGKTLVILVSQSGETADTIAAMREAKSKGAVTLSIVNVIGSTIAKEADYCLLTSAGPEIAVATTKAFSAQLVLLYVLAARFAVKLGKLPPESFAELMSEFETLPDKAKEIFEHIDLIQKHASECVVCKSIFFIGRNIDYAIALEGSLKLKEISYIHSEAYAGGELKHGTISLIEEDTLVVAISNCKRLYGKIMSNVEQVISRGAKVLLIGCCPEAEPSSYDGKLSYIGLPEITELFSPSLSVIVLQLFSYYVAANKGLDIDKPRNLAKSVTVE